MMTFTAREKYRAIVREIAMRKSVYPELIRTGQLTRGEAAYQLAVMESIAADYAQLANMPTQEKLL